MTSVFKIGQHIDGKVGTYIISKQLHKDIWSATYHDPATYQSISPLTLNRSHSLGKVIIKTPPKYRLDNERDILKHFHARPGIRQLLDETQNPPALVLNHLDDNLLSASNSKRLEKSEIKLVAKRILEGLQELHKDHYVHTGTYSPTLCHDRLFGFLRRLILTRPLDIKPDNILVNYGIGSSRFAEVELGDCGDACYVNPLDHLRLGETGHVIGAHMFRSPEAMLNLRWGTPTDIWSFGATVSSLLHLLCLSSR